MSRVAFATGVALCALLTTTGPALAQRAEQRLEVLFVADGAGPIAVVEVHERGEGEAIARAASWALFTGDVTVLKTVEDRVRGARGAPPLVDLPSAPAGLGLASDDDGTLLFTLDELGDWQASLDPSVAPASPRGGPAVPSRSSARLLVEPPAAAVPPTRYTTRAVLYGTAGAYEGFALVDARAQESTGALVLASARGLDVEPFAAAERASERAFIPDRASACGRPVPSALLLWPEEAPPARLVSSSTAACLPDGRALIPLAGVRLEARRDTPLRAILVDDP